MPLELKVPDVHLKMLKIIKIINFRFVADLFCVSLHLSYYLVVCLSVRSLHVCMPVSLHSYLSVCLSTCPSVSLVCLCVCLSIFVCLSVSLSVCLSVSRSLFLSLSHTTTLSLHEDTELLSDGTNLRKYIHS